MSTDDDAPTIPCPRCRDGGMVCCPWCHGTGRVPDDDKCQTCSGTGGRVAKCPVCGGTGKAPPDDAPRVTCQACNGSGYLYGMWSDPDRPTTSKWNCPKCDGKGTIPDPDATDLHDCDQAAAELYRVNGENGAG